MSQTQKGQKLFLNFLTVYQVYLIKPNKISITLK